MTILTLAMRQTISKSLHPEEARSAVTKDEGTVCGTILRDAAEEAAPQDEGRQAW